jgi:hypothetical protein
VNYFFIALITTSIAAVILYYLLNKVFRIKISVIPLALSVACSLFLSMALPKVIIRFTDWIGTVGVLVMCSLIFAYFLAYYDKQWSMGIALDCENQPPFETALSTPTDILRTEHVFIDIEAPLNLQDTEITNENMVEDETSVCMDVYSDTNLAPLPSFSTTDTEDVLSLCEGQEDLVAENAADLLDRAFRFKEQQDFDSAAKLFRTVLQLNHESDAAPLVIIEIADSLRHTGAYLEAIDLLEDSLTFTVVKGQMPLELHIRAMIDTLKQLQVGSPFIAG